MTIFNTLVSLYLLHRKVHFGTVLLIVLLITDTTVIWIIGQTELKTARSKAFLWNFMFVHLLRTTPIILKFSMLKFFSKFHVNGDIFLV